MRLSNLLLALTLCLGTTFAISSCRDGDCEEDAAGYRICASGSWVLTMTSHYKCKDGRIVSWPASGSKNTVLDMSQNLTQFTRIQQTSSTTASLPGPTVVPGPTGYSLCNGVMNHGRESFNGVASYSRGGRMASMYEADRSSIFRCSNVLYPSDEFFVALWTQFDPSLIGTSQPAPLNCGQRINLRNARNGIVANATVIDRCASCVGVGFDPRDSTLDLGLVNGATIDLSPKLWAHLYKDLDPGVYDIEYGEPPLAGWNMLPAVLPATCSMR